MPDQGAPQLDMAEIHRIAAAAAAEAAAAAIAAAFAAQASITGTRNESAQKKKPDLPNFDAKNVGIWIQRVEAAYTRAAVTAPKDKFAFLESQFDVGFNPSINAFLFKPDPTDSTWTDFLVYLKKEYGRTQQQKAASVLDGVSRDGRRPTQLLAFIDDRLDDVTIDDIKKEMLLRQLPREIRHALAVTVKTATAKALAEQADHYFDRDGKPLNAAADPSVNSVQQHENIVDDTEVNAALGNPNRGRSSFLRNESNGASSTSSSSQSWNRSASRNNRSKSRPRLYDGHCYFHHKFKDQAKKCEDGCKFNKSASGNGQAGRRT